MKNLHSSAINIFTSHIVTMNVQYGSPSYVSKGTKLVPFKTSFKQKLQDFFNDAFSSSLYIMNEQIKFPTKFSCSWAKSLVNIKITLNIRHNCWIHIIDFDFNEYAKISAILANHIFDLHSQFWSHFSDSIISFYAEKRKFKSHVILRDY